MSVDMQTILSSVSALFTILLSIIAWFMRDKLAQVEGRIGEQIKRVDDHLSKLDDRAKALELGAAAGKAEMQQVVTMELLQRELAKFATRADHANLMGRLETVAASMGELRETLARIETRLPPSLPLPARRRGKA